MRPPEEKGKAGGQAILAAKTVRRNLFLPLAGGGAQHRRVVIHAAGCLPSVGSAASSPQGEEPAKCRNYSPTLTTALETPGSCRRGSPGLLRVPVRADERCDVHLAGFEQADGVFEGERVDEGALNGQLLLIDIVGVHLEVRLLRAHAEHEHLRALLGGGHGLRWVAGKPTASMITS